MSIFFFFFFFATHDSKEIYHIDDMQIKEMLGLGRDSGLRKCKKLLVILGVWNPNTENIKGRSLHLMLWQTPTPLLAFFSFLLPCTLIPWNQDACFVVFSVIFQKHICENKIIASSISFSEVVELIPFQLSHWKHPHDRSCGSVPI